MDLVVTGKEDQIINSVPRSDSFLSNHSSVLCDTIDWLKSATRSVQFRRVKNLDIPTFKRDVSDMLPSMLKSTSLDLFVEDLNISLLSTLDCHVLL